MDFFLFLESLCSYMTVLKWAFIHPGPGSTQAVKLYRFRNKHEGNSLPFCKYPAFVTTFSIEGKYSLVRDRETWCLYNCVDTCVRDTAKTLSQWPVTWHEWHRLTRHKFRCFSLSNKSIVSKHSRHNPWRAKLCLPCTGEMNSAVCSTEGRLHVSVIRSRFPWWEGCNIPFPLTYTHFSIPLPSPGFLSNAPVTI